MKILLIRHADPDYANDSLTPAGHREAQALATRLRRMGIDRIFSSPLGRAQATMRYAAEATGLEPTTLPWTAELHWPTVHQQGLGEGSIWDVHGHTVHGLGAQLTRRNWQDLPPFNASPEFAAGFRRVQQGSDATLAELGYAREGDRYRVAHAHRQQVAFFCHGGLGVTWLAHLLNLPLPLAWVGFFLPPSSVTTILFDERCPEYATPRCLGIGDISHLYAAGLPMQPVGIKTNRE